ncbi:hypothetical protein PYW07_000338 [Mythimna separata]|uniref:Uncharacterized protein n=1 Tax=Mythimna separata TaxID=271217 RepID=A0AAD8E1F0_MYTSE|nr:hypothetical protein PYW07_000338 [Mythimna separata]
MKLYPGLGFTAPVPTCGCVCLRGWGCPVHFLLFTSLITCDVTSSDRRDVTPSDRPFVSYLRTVVLINYPLYISVCEREDFDPTPWLTQITPKLIYPLYYCNKFLYCYIIVFFSFLGRH